MTHKSAGRLLAIGLLFLGAVVFVIKYSTSRIAAEPAPGAVWVEPTTGMKFVWVPSGCFNMGAEDDEESQKPVHRVCLKGFYLGQFEVTQAEYEKTVGVNPCAQACDRYLGPDRAVTHVRWEDAQNAAQILGRRSGKQIRLPSESEWEYACLAGGRHKRYCGDGQLSALAWIGQSRYGPALDRPQVVGGKQANAWGLFDMMGNVSEYVQDCWHGNYNDAPADGTAWMGGYCDARLYRGGSWDTSDQVVATARGHLEKDADPLSWRSNGFRLVMSVE
jgi:formylglycine-generating enzyme required for sulfatase activity